MHSLITPTEVSIDTTSLGAFLYPRGVCGVIYIPSEKTEQARLEQVWQFQPQTEFSTSFYESLKKKLTGLLTDCTDSLCLQETP